MLDQQRPRCYRGSVISRSALRMKLTVAAWRRVHLGSQYVLLGFHLFRLSLGFCHPSVNALGQPFPSRHSPSSLLCPVLYTRCERSIATALTCRIIFNAMTYSGILLLIGDISRVVQFKISELWLGPIEVYLFISPNTSPARKSLSLLCLDRVSSLLEHIT